MNSFTGVVQVLYVLFRNKHLRNITWWLLPLFVNCEMLFNFIFRTFQKHAFCQILFGGRSYYMLIVKFWMLRKLLNNRSSRPEVFCKKVLLKTSKKWQENTCARVYFLVKFQVRDCNFIKKRHQHRCFPVKYAKFILQNTSGGINKKKQSSQAKSFVENNLLLYNWLITQQSIQCFSLKQNKELLVFS